MSAAAPPAPGVIPQPVTVPDLAPDATADALLALAVDAAFEDIRVGVQFDPRGKVYAYIAPPTAHVGSIVIVPGNRYNPDPQTVDVVTLDPPPYNGPLARVLAVLT